MRKNTQTKREARPINRLNERESGNPAAPPPLLPTEGPFPTHYEPFDTPLGFNPMYPDNPKATSSPAARVFKHIWETFGSAKDFPHVGTTYRLTEHFHYWTKHALVNAITQPEQFVEIGEALAKEIGIGILQAYQVTFGAGDAVGVQAIGGKGFAVAGHRRHIFPEVQTVIVALAFIVLGYQLQLTVLVNLNGSRSHYIQAVGMLKPGLGIIKDQRIVIAIIPAAKTLIGYR